MGMFPDVREMISKKNTTQLQELKWYNQYRETRDNGDIIPGDQIRIFLDWYESTPDRPRYARLTQNKIITYLDSELTPVEESGYETTYSSYGSVAKPISTSTTNTSKENS